MSLRFVWAVMAAWVWVAGVASARSWADKPTKHVAELRDDVDGDGKADRMFVRADGQAIIETTSGQTSKTQLAGAPREVGSATIDVRRGRGYGGRTVILFTADNAHASVMAIHAKRIATLWQGAIGPQGADREYSIHVALSPYGLIRYASRPEVERCDGRPARLDLERFDFRSGAFRPASEPAHIPDTAPTLTATPVNASDEAENLATAKPVAFFAAATSSQLGVDSAHGLSAPVAIADGDPSTAWVEGQTGYGRGELVTFKSALGKVKVEAIRFIPGHAASPEAFRASNRIRTLVLLVGDAGYWVKLARDPARTKAPATAPYIVRLPAPVSASCVTAVIREVYPGKGARGRRGNTAIAELAVLTDVELSPGGGYPRLAAQVAAGDRGYRRAAMALADGGADAAHALTAALANPEVQSAARRRLYAALARVGDPAAASALARGLADPAVTAKLRRALTLSLATLGAAAAPPLAEILASEQTPSDGRQAAAQALAKIPGDAARTALVTAAGHGSRALRREIARALGSRDPGELPALIAAAQTARGSSSKVEADLWRAVALLTIAAEPTARHKAQAAIAHRLATAEGYELLYRLIAAAARIGNPDAVRKAIAAPALTTGENRDAKVAALHRVAATHLAENPAPSATALLLTLTAGSDPGTRAAATGALAARDPDHAGADPALIARLADTWPHVRRAAAAALGTRCQRADPARALTHTVTADDATEVRRTALGSLVTCRAQGIGALLLATAASTDQPVAVRTHAAHLLAILDDRRLVPEITTLLTELRRRAFSEDGAGEVAADIAATLGALGDPSAAPALIAAARDPAFPAIQAAAAIALGRLCITDSKSLLAKLSGSSQREVALAAQAALARWAETCAE